MGQELLLRRRMMMGRLEYPVQFTVNANLGKVLFSKGNLWYNRSNGVFSFEEHPYGYHQYTANSVGLFGWGTSGYNHGAHCYQPDSVDMTDSRYYAYGNMFSNLYDQTGQADWGYNAISNGGNTEHVWRTLKIEEWHYLLFARSTPSGKRFAKGGIMVGNEVFYGVVILPDYWSDDSYPLANVNSASSDFVNIIQEQDWDVLDSKGAVFLPCGGYREGNNCYTGNERGYYYASDAVVFNSEIKGTAVSFSSNHLRTYYVQPQTPETQFRHIGCSVRLVKDL